MATDAPVIVEKNPPHRPRTIWSRLLRMLVVDSPTGPGRKAGHMKFSAVLIARRFLRLQGMNRQTGTSADGVTMEGLDDMGYDGLSVR